MKRNKSKKVVSKPVVKAASSQTASTGLFGNPVNQTAGATSSFGTQPVSKPASAGGLFGQ